GFRRQLVGGVSPVGVGKGAETAGGDKRIDLVLHRLEVGSRIIRPVRKRRRQGGRLDRIGLEAGGDIDPVERMQVIKVNNVILHNLDTHDDVADQLGIGGDLYLESIFNSPDGGDRMDRSAYTAETLRP